MLMQMDPTDYCLIVLLPTGAIFLLCGYRCFRRGWADDFHVTRVAPIDAIEGTMDGTSASTGTLTAAEKESLRKQVLTKIFPVEDQKEGGKRTVLTYDVETNRYTRQNDTETAVASPSCSICLEGFEPSASIVTAACKHSYHSKCILDWVAKRDDCPNCRASMWNAAEFDRILEEELTSRSGRFVNV